MAYEKFDPVKLERLNDPARLETMSPDVLWRALGEPEHARVIIEIGAGTGLFASEFLARAPHAVLYATDIVDDMLEWMRANRPEVEAGRLVPRRSHEGQVPLQDSLADVVYMLNVHHELAEPDSIYAEALRLLKPEGRLLVADWAPGDSPKGPPQHVRVSGSDIAQILDAIGFGNVRVHEGALPWHSVVTAARSSRAG